MTVLFERVKMCGLTVIATALMAAPVLAQGRGPGPGPGTGSEVEPWWGYGYRHPMMGWGDGRFGGGWMFAHGLISLFALVGVVAVVIAIARFFCHGRCHHFRHGGGAALEALETRYARSEIGRDEYLEKKRDLTGRS